MSEFEKMDETLTQEEKDAKTFLEWSDKTLARAVRHCATAIKDDMGNFAMLGTGAACVLSGIAKKANAETLKIDIGGYSIVATRNIFTG